MSGKYSVKRNLPWLIIGYITLCIFMYFKQEALIFPSALSFGYNDPQAKFIQSTDGTKLETRFYSATTENQPIVILFTGNAQNAVAVGKVIWDGFEQSMNIATMNYRAYGRSEGNPTEENLFKDALQFTKKIKEQHKGQKIYLMGISLGTGVVSYLASKESTDGIILMTPFDSIANVAASTYPFLPVRALLRHHFNSVEHLKNVNTPIAIIRAEDDEVIPNRLTDNLANKVNKLAYDITLKDMRHTQLLNSPEKPLLKTTLKDTLKALENK